VHHVSSRTIKRKLDKYEVIFHGIDPTSTVVIMDTSYFGHEFGVMVFRDEYSKRNLHWKYVKHESLSEYIYGIERLKKQGWNIKGIVCDGKRGLFTAFGDIPVQMCQFHQAAIVTRYITRNPKTIAGKELKQIIVLLPRTDKESFEGVLKEWILKWNIFLNEKTYNEENKSKWHYTHKRLRSAYQSLKHNLPYLFTWYDYPQLKMPNTTNSLEGTFSNLKTKLRVHNGLKQWRKMKVINNILNS